MSMLDKLRPRRTKDPHVYDTVHGPTSDMSNLETSAKNAAADVSLLTYLFSTADDMLLDDGLVEPVATVVGRVRSTLHNVLSEDYNDPRIVVMPYASILPFWTYRNLMTALDPAILWTRYKIASWDPDSLKRCTPEYRKAWATWNEQESSVPSS